MRAVPAGNGVSTDPSADSLARTPSSAPVTCFIADEATMDGALERGFQRLQQHSDRRKQQPDLGSRATFNRWAPASPMRFGGSTSSLCDAEQDILRDSSRPSTPLLAGMSGPESILSSTSSRRNSLLGSSMDDLASMGAGITAPMPYGQDDEHEGEDIVPQLIMPSMTVPRRRPYSEVGKSLGKLKLMIAGQPGIGKTSLIKSISQHCEHIVHVESMDAPKTTLVSETYASSKPRPWWRTNAEDLGRKRSSKYEVLDRNICFVECSGLPDSATDLIPGLQYLESQLTQLLGKYLEDADLHALVDAGEEPVVDVLLYMISHEGPKPADIDYMRRAQAMTNVVPILARADMLEGEAVDFVRDSASRNLTDGGVECFCFASLEAEEKGSWVYAISNETQEEYDVMDASVLMGSQYVPPLVPTDLSKLVEHIFSQDGTSRLRHAAAAKCVKWRRQRGHGVLQLTSRRQYGNIPDARERFYYPDSAMQRRYWGRLDLFNWASNLRQSLHAELMYHTWSASMEAQSAGGESQLVSARYQQRDEARGRNRRAPCLRQQDPLGILEFGGILKQRGRLLLELVSSLGLLGYAISCMRQSELEAGACLGSFGGMRRVGMEPTGWWLSLS